MSVQVIFLLSGGMKLEELEGIGGCDISDGNKNQKFVTVIYSNNQEIRTHMICLHIYNNMLCSNIAYILFCILCYHN